MIIQDIYELDIFIDKLNILTTPGVIFSSARIYESISKPVPSCELELIVPIGWLDQRSIVDGTLIEFQIKCTIFNFQEKLSFRLFNISRIQLDQKFATIKLVGVLDFYDGYRHANEYNLYGKSSDIFNLIANDFNLDSDIDTTNDKQLWVSTNKNLYSFFIYLAAHGWIDETSAMLWFFNRNKKLNYKNLTNIFRERSNDLYKFVQTAIPDYKNKEYVYANAIVSVQAGFENLVNGGYGGKDNYFDLLSYEWKEINPKKVIAESNLINISKELAQGLAQQWYPFDFGNFHPNYWLAYKQNKRILATYSTIVALNCQFFMPYQLGELVNFILQDSQDMNNKVNSISGTFVVSAIKINISLQSITSDLELVMQGLNGVARTRETY